MKRTNATKMMSCLLMTMVLAISSCSDNNSTQTTDTTSGERTSESDGVIQDGMNTASDGLDGSVDGVSNGGRIAACASVVYNDAAKTVTIDFGSGCTGPDGRTRSGKIAIQFGGTRQQTTTRSITFTAYKVNGSSIDGVISQTNIQRPDSLHYSASVAATGLAVVLSDGKTYTVTDYQRTITINYGATLKSINDDITTLTGSSTTINSNNVVTTVTITSPITFLGSCTATGFYYPASGTYKITQGAITYTVDWGSGTCDKIISVTALGKTTDKTLP